MNLRRESVLHRIFIKFFLDPLLGSKKNVDKLRKRVKGRDPLTLFALKYLLDPTILPPPSYTRKRADQVYGDMFRRCVEFSAKNDITGDYLEFGTLQGYTARWLACFMREYNVDANLLLFDSFEGLPEISSDIDQNCYDVAVNKSWFKGAMSVNHQEVDKLVGASLQRIIGGNRLQIIKGYYDETVPQYLPSGPVALVHLDCDLYSSASLVLNELLTRNLFQDGTLLIMDDFNCNRANNAFGERKALHEAFSRQGRYSLLEWFSYGWHGTVLIVNDSSISNL